MQIDIDTKCEGVEKEGNIFTCNTVVGVQEHATQTHPHHHQHLHAPQQQQQPQPSAEVIYLVQR